MYILPNVCPLKTLPEAPDGPRLWLPGRYSTAHKNSIHQDERNLLRTGGATKEGGQLVSETGGWRSRSDTERYE